MNQKTNFVDINEYDCIAWLKIHGDCKIPNTHALCEKCHDWYLRINKFSKLLCIGCSSKNITKTIKSVCSFRKFTNDTSIVIQQRFKYSKTRSISIPRVLIGSVCFSNSLLDQFNDGISWEDGKEQSQIFKSENDLSEKLNKIRKLDTAYKDCMTKLISIKLILDELSYE
ncbi:MAG: hypothetical protein COB02_11850 [Candidatus Cloacimonadota bacterium]|nr:MAG: hypothetical protein COB02_11850 [Candidatus Cloacimonadota bacterium]